VLAKVSTIPAVGASLCVPLDQFTALAARLPDQIQFIAPTSDEAKKGRRLTKPCVIRGSSYGRPEFRFPYRVLPHAVTAFGLRDAVRLLQVAEADPRGLCMVLGALNIDDARVATELAKTGHVRRTKKDEPGKLPCFIEVPRHLYVIDFDPTAAQHAWCRQQGLDVFVDADWAVRQCVKAFLPVDFQHCAYAYQLSAGGGLKSGALDGSHVKFHAFIWLKTPLEPAVIKRWVASQVARNNLSGCAEIKKNKQISGGLDLALYQAVQPHFISARFEGGPDPLAGKRWGIVENECEYLDLRLETEEREVLLELPNGTAIKSVRSERVLTSHFKHFVGRTRIDAPGAKWPHSWRERLKLISERGINNTLLATTFALAREFDDTYGPQADFHDVTAPYFRVIEDAIDAERGSRTQSEIDGHKGDIRRMYSSGLVFVRAIKAERKKQRDASVAPRFPDKRVPLEEGKRQLNEYVSAWFLAADEALAAVHQQKGAEAAWIEAGKPAAKDSRSFPYPLRLAPPPRLIVAGETGLGKTQIILTQFFESGRAAKTRLYMAVPNHEKAEELARDYLETAKRLKIEDARVTIFQGLERACNADEKRKTAALDAARFGLSPKKNACVGCKLAKNCEWLKQASDNGPGLKIVVSAYLGIAVPGMARKKDEDGEDDSAPILGFVIDEQYEGHLKHEAELSKADIPDTRDFAVLGIHGKEEDLFRITVKRVRKVAEKEGRIQFADFADILRGNHQTDNVNYVAADGWRLKVDVLCELLGDIVYESKRQASDEIKKALSEDRAPNVAKALNRAIRVSAFRDLFVLLRSTFNGERTETSGCRVVGKDAPKFKMSWMKRLPDEVATSSVLLLDATADPVISRLPFALREDVSGYDILPDIPIARIMVEAPHQELIKVIEAPVGKRKLENSATKAIKKQDEGECDVAQSERSGVAAVERSTEGGRRNRSVQESGPQKAGLNALRCRLGRSYQSC
jgi:hypothetical protein